MVETWLETFGWEISELVRCREAARIAASSLAQIPGEKTETGVGKVR